MKKKHLLFLLSFFMFTTTIFITACHGTETNAKPNTKPKIIPNKKAMSSSIKGYIAGLPIQCYEVDGEIGIIAEDLEKYGFRVRFYNGDSSAILEYWEEQGLDVDSFTISDIPELIIHYSFDYDFQKDIEIHATKDLEFNSEEYFDIYETDIVTRVKRWSEYEIKSYNIGDKTIIPMSALEFCGDITYYADENKICFEFTPPWHIFVNSNYKNEEEDKDIELELDEDGQDIYTEEYVANFYAKLNEKIKNNVSNCDVIAKKNNDGKFEMTGELGVFKVLDGFSMDWDKELGLSFEFVFTAGSDIWYDASSFLGALSDVVTSSNYPDRSVEKNVNAANKQFQIYINDEKLDIINVWEYRDNGNYEYSIKFNKNISNLDDIQTIRLISK